MKMNIGIIVLNYMCWEATVKSVACFQSRVMDHQSYDPDHDIHVQIVIVDNNSPNDSYIRLHSEYQNSDHVHVLKTDQNIGYARGNNFGYQYLKTIMHADFVIVSNDDAYANAKGLYQWIFKMYEKYGYGILGPSVLSMRSGLHQSPWNDEMDCFAHLASRYTRNRNKELCVVRKRNEDNLKYDRFHDDMIVSGAFLIFSEKYLEKYNDLFNPRTFLYAEENLLKIRCEQYDLKMIYDPSYEVEHEESASFYDGKTEEEVQRDKNRYYLEAMDIYDHELWRLKRYGLFRRLFDLAYICGEDKKGHEYVFPTLRSFKKSKIVIYGAGKMGTALYERCMRDKDFTVIGWVDRNKRSELIRDPSSIGQFDFDYIIIAINDRKTVEEITEGLKEQGISADKIKWIKGYRIHS